MNSSQVSTRLGLPGIPKAAETMMLDGVLALAAKDDMLVPHTASEAFEAVPGAALAWMGWGDHACNVTDPGTFNLLVLDFLRAG